ncbi:hypothetical protein J6590_051452, partial [Homalodisca vitripennis]
MAVGGTGTHPAHPMTLTLGPTQVTRTNPLTGSILASGRRLTPFLPTDTPPPHPRTLLNWANAFVKVNTVVIPLTQEFDRVSSGGGRNVARNSPICQHSHSHYGEIDEVKAHDVSQATRLAVNRARPCSAVNPSLSLSLSLPHTCCGVAASRLRHLDHHRRPCVVLEGNKPSEDIATSAQKGLIIEEVSQTPLVLFNLSSVVKDGLVLVEGNKLSKGIATSWVFFPKCSERPLNQRFREVSDSQVKHLFCQSSCLVIEDSLVLGWRSTNPPRELLRFAAEVRRSVGWSGQTPLVLVKLSSYRGRRPWVGLEGNKLAEGITTFESFFRSD